MRIRLTAIAPMAALLAVLCFAGAAEARSHAAWADHTAFDATLIGPVAPHTRTTLYLDLNTRSKALDYYLRRIHSRNYIGVRLTPREVEQRFGATPRDIAAVKAWAATHGLSTRVGRTRTHIRVRGTTQTITRLFRLGSVGRYTTRWGYRYRAATKAPTVPTALRGTVAYVFGLDHVITPPRKAIGTPIATPAVESTPVPVRSTPQASVPATSNTLTPPSDVWGVYGDSSITAQWEPVSAGTFTAVATPGGASCRAPADTIQCQITGLTNGTAYTIVVTVTAPLKTSGVSAPSTPITPSAPWPATCASLNSGSGVPTPHGIATQYGFAGLAQSANTAPQTIAVLSVNMLPDIGDVLAARDNCNTIPNPESITIRAINLAGAATTVGLEVDFDTQWVAALAPANTSIVVINMPNTLAGWIEAMDAAQALPNLQALTISYGLPEQWLYNDAQMVAASERTTPIAVIGTLTNAFATVAANAGIYVSAGDQGSMGASTAQPPGCATNTTGDAEVSWPASLPTVTAVGGTMWPTGPTRAGESVWFQAIGTLPSWPCLGAATGGGISQIYTQNSWALPAAAGSSSTMRTVPDLALLGGPPGYLMAYQGSLTAFMGTSASAPVLAVASLSINAEMAAVGNASNSMGLMTPYLYAMAAQSPNSFTDITSGSNDLFGNGECCTAGPGYDLTSGLGVPADMSNWPSLFGLASAPLLTPTTPPLTEN